MVLVVKKKFFALIQRGWKRCAENEARFKNKKVGDMTNLDTMKIAINEKYAGLTSGPSPITEKKGTRTNAIGGLQFLHI